MSGVKCTQKCGLLQRDQPEHHITRYQHNRLTSMQFENAASFFITDYTVFGAFNIVVDVCKNY